MITFGKARELVAQAGLDSPSPIVFGSEFGMVLFAHITSEHSSAFNRAVIHIGVSDVAHYLVQAQYEAQDAYTRYETTQDIDRLCKDVMYIVNSTLARLDWRDL